MIQFGSMCEIPNVRYVPDLLRSKFHMWMHNYHWIPNIVYIVLVGLIDPFAVVYAYFVPTLMMWHAGSFINTINHTLGYKTNTTKDASTNNLFTGYLVSGEGWHNNHHARPGNYDFGSGTSGKWWEFDPTARVIELIRK